MGKRILVIDDEEGIAQVLKRYLASRGYNVDAEYCAEGALRRLSSETFDAIFLDVNLPGMNGMQALEKIESCTAAPVFIISGYADEELQKDMLLLGARGFLLKPLDLPAVARQLEGLVWQK